LVKITVILKVIVDVVTILERYFLLITLLLFFNGNESSSLLLLLVEREETEGSFESGVIIIFNVISYLLHL
jgi:hypothetical protein